MPEISDPIEQESINLNALDYLARQAQRDGEIEAELRRRDPTREQYSNRWQDSVASARQLHPGAQFDDTAAQAVYLNARDNAFMQGSLRDHATPQGEMRDHQYWANRFPVLGALKQAVENFVVSSNTEALNRGERITQEGLREVGRHESESQWSRNRGIAGRALDTATAIPGLAAEFMATSGIGNAASGAARAGVAGLLRGGASTLAGRAAVNVAGGLAAGAAQAAAMPWGAARNITDRLVPDLAFRDGQLMIGRDRDLGEAVWKGYLDHQIEVLSERMGEGLTDAFAWAGNLLRRVPGGMRAAAVAAAVGRRAERIGANAGFHGVFGEMLEERAGEIMRGVTGVEGNFGASGHLASGRYLAALEQLTVEGLSFLPFGVAQRVGDRAANRPSPHPNQVAIRELMRGGMSAPEARAKVEETIVKVLLDPTHNPDNPALRTFADSFREALGEEAQAERQQAERQPALVGGQPMPVRQPPAAPATQQAESPTQNSQVQPEAAPGVPEAAPEAPVAPPVAPPSPDSVRHHFPDVSDSDFSAAVNAEIGDANKQFQKWSDKSQEFLRQGRPISDREMQHAQQMASLYLWRAQQYQKPKDTPSAPSIFERMPLATLEKQAKQAKQGVRGARIELERRQKAAKAPEAQEPVQPAPEAPVSQPEAKEGITIRQRPSPMVALNRALAESQAKSVPKRERASSGSYRPDLGVIAPSEGGTKLISGPRNEPGTAPAKPSLAERMRKKGAQAAAQGVAHAEGAEGPKPLQKPRTPAQIERDRLAKVADVRQRIDSDPASVTHEELIESGLDARESHILRRRLEPDAPSLEVIARDPIMLKADGKPLTRERIRQLEVSANRKLGRDLSIAVAVHQKVKDAARDIASGKKVDLKELHVDPAEVAQRARSMVDKINSELDDITDQMIALAEEAKAKGAKQSEIDKILEPLAKESEDAQRRLTAAQRRGKPLQGEAEASRPTDAVAGEPRQVPGQGQSPVGPTPQRPEPARRKPPASVEAKLGKSFEMTEEMSKELLRIDDLQSKASEAKGRRESQRAKDPFTKAMVKAEKDYDKAREAYQSAFSDFEVKFGIPANVAYKFRHDSEYEANRKQYDENWRKAFGPEAAAVDSPDVDIQPHLGERGESVAIAGRGDPKWLHYKGDGYRVIGKPFQDGGEMWVKARRMVDGKPSPQTTTIPLADAQEFAPAPITTPRPERENISRGANGKFATEDVRALSPGHARVVDILHSAIDAETFSATIKADFKDNLNEALAGWSPENATALAARLKKATFFKDTADMGETLSKRSKKIRESVNLGGEIGGAAQVDTGHVYLDGHAEKKSAPELYVHEFFHFLFDQYANDPALATAFEREAGLISNYAKENIAEFFCESGRQSHFGGLNPNVTPLTHAFFAKHRLNPGGSIGERMPELFDTPIYDGPLHGDTLLKTPEIQMMVSFSDSKEAAQNVHDAFQDKMIDNLSVMKRLKKAASALGVVAPGMDPEVIYSRLMFADMATAREWLDSGAWTLYNGKRTEIGKSLPYVLEPLSKASREAYNGVGMTMFSNPGELSKAEAFAVIRHILDEHNRGREAVGPEMLKTARAAMTEFTIDPAFMAEAVEFHNRLTAAFNATIWALASPDIHFIDQAKAADLVAERPTYVPLTRDMSDEAKGGKGKGAAFLSKRKGGSEQLIISPLVTYMKRVSIASALMNEQIKRTSWAAYLSQPGMEAFGEIVPGGADPVGAAAATKTLKEMGISDPDIADFVKVMGPHAGAYFTNTPWRPGAANIVAWRSPSGLVKFKIHDKSLYDLITDQQADSSATAHFFAAMSKLPGVKQLADIVRFTATTASMAFHVRNAIIPTRDQYEFLKNTIDQSSVGQLYPALVTAYKMEWDLARGKVASDAVFKLFHRERGDSQRMLSFSEKKPSEIYKTLRDVDSKAGLVMDVIKSAMKVVGAGELAPRYVEFANKLKQLGWSKERLATEIEKAEAAKAAGRPYVDPVPWYVVQMAMEAAGEVTVPFHRQGVITREINRTVPFFGPAVTGLAKNIRNWKVNPKGAAIALSAYLAVRLLHYLMVKDEDWYKELSDKDKFNNFVVNIPGLGLRRIPGARDLEVPIGGALVAMLEACNGRDARLGGLTMESLEALTPPLPLPTPAKIAWELGRNKDWSGRPIVPRSDEKMPWQSNALNHQLPYVAGQLTGGIHRSLTPLPTANPQQSVTDIFARLETLESRRLEAHRSLQRFEGEAEYTRLNAAATRIRELAMRARGDRKVGNRVVRGTPPDADTIRELRKRQIEIARRALGR